MLRQCDETNTRLRIS